MGRSKEYLAVRYDPGTSDRVDELRGYVGAVHMNGRPAHQTVLMSCGATSAPFT